MTRRRRRSPDFGARGALASSARLDTARGVHEGTRMAAPATVLVVDDDSDLRTTIASTLSGAGYDVSEAASGRRAIESVAHEAPSVILLDLMMPDGNGWEVLERLRTRKLAGRSPVIVMSAYASAAPAGARAVLRKPIRQEELLSTIGAYLRAA